MFESTPGFSTAPGGIEPRLRACAFFRAATDEEVGASYAAYAGGDFARLCDVWREVASPTRATLPGSLGRAYDRAHLAPSAVNAQAFLASVRAVLAAGKRFRARLSDESRRALEHEFPWLEHRHEHIPSGWTPELEFPAEFSEWIERSGGAARAGHPALDDTRARWQLAAALNEVQQAHYSAHAAERFRLPALKLHAERERALALNYLGHWAPPVTEALWRECIFVLDGLNAAVFEMMCSTRPAEMVGRSLVGALTRGADWRAFVDGLSQPQRLVPLS